jgi:hypothetical protein
VDPLVGEPAAKEPDPAGDPEGEGKALEPAALGPVADHVEHIAGGQPVERSDGGVDPLVGDQAGHHQQPAATVGVGPGWPGQQRAGHPVADHQRPHPEVGGDQRGLAVRDRGDLRGVAHDPSGKRPVHGVEQAGGRCVAAAMVVGGEHVGPDAGPPGGRRHGRVQIVDVKGVERQPPQPTDQLRAELKGVTHAGDPDHLVRRPPVGVRDGGGAPAAAAEGEHGHLVAGGGQPGCELGADPLDPTDAGGESAGDQKDPHRAPRRPASLPIDRVP